MVRCAIKPWRRRIRASRDASGNLVITLPLQRTFVEIQNAVFHLATDAELREIEMMWSEDERKRRFYKKGFTLFVELCE